MLLKARQSWLLRRLRLEGPLRPRVEDQPRIVRPSKQKELLGRWHSTRVTSA